MNLSFKENPLPYDFKETKVCPIYKGKGSRDDPNNYRPISIIPHVAKILESYVQTQLMQYFIRNNLLSSDQSAFLKDRSTQTSLHRVIDHWLEAADCRQVTGVTFFDLKKCFDTIPHDILLYKLKKYGITGHEYTWFRNYLSDRRQKVIFNNKKSDLMDITMGIPQGSNLGPLMFLIFINDFMVTVPGVRCNIYADDTAIYFSSTTIDTVRYKLQEAVNHALNWFKSNKLTINATKSYTMLICNSRNIHHDASLNITVDGTNLEQVSSFKYLGVMLDSELTWSPHIDLMCNKISQNVGALRRLSQFLPDFLLNKVYVSNIQPLFDYCCTVWGNSSQDNINRLQRLQNRAARLITNLHNDKN